MRLFPVLNIKAEKKSPKNVSFHSVRLWCKIAKKGECSVPLLTFSFLSELMRAANCVRSCLNPFCREVNGVAYCSP